ncbi:MAG: hypothetical protein HY537_06750 [Deltaproteobacteria bacterium]|nr:hypothetical protein [Deltaproteobacteria bacterium]
MKTTMTTRRVLLSEKAANDVADMIINLKEGHDVTVLPSKTVSWIVSEFAARHFDRSQDQMKAVLIDRKALLHSLVARLNEADPQEMQRLNLALKKLCYGKHRGRARIKAGDTTQTAGEPTETKE